MTNEQQLFWSYFKWDPQLFAVSEAEAIKNLPPEQRQQRINRAFDRLLDNEQDPWILARVVKTWLSKYHLQLEPDSVTRFDEFHVIIRSLVNGQPQKIDQLETY